jgi:hypothetical protein
MSPTPLDNFTTFSNLFVIPAIVFSLYKRLWATASILTTLGAVSLIYHACQTDLFCLFESEVAGQQDYFLLQVLDEVNVYLTIVWFILFFLEINYHLRATALLLSYPVFALTFVSDSDYDDVINWMVVGVVIVCAVVYNIYNDRGIRIGTVSLSLAIVFIVVGLVMFFNSSNFEDGDNYNLFHGLWHMFLFLALFLLIFSKFEPGSFILRA